MISSPSVLFQNIRMLLDGEVSDSTQNSTQKENLVTLHLSLNNVTEIREVCRSMRYFLVI